MSDNNKLMIQVMCFLPILIDLLAKSKSIFREITFMEHNMHV